MDKSYRDVFVEPVQATRYSRGATRSARRLDQATLDWSRASRHGQWSMGLDFRDDIDDLANYQAAVDPATGGETPDPGTTNGYAVQTTVSAAYVTDRIRHGKWEVLLGLRNLFRDPTDSASVYDELLVVRPPKRIVGGVLAVGFALSLAAARRCSASAARPASNRAHHPHDRAIASSSGISAYRRKKDFGSRKAVPSFHASTFDSIPTVAVEGAMPQATPIEPHTPTRREARRLIPVSAVASAAGGGS